MPPRPPKPNHRSAPADLQLGRLRKALGFTQIRLAEVINLDQSRLSKVERSGDLRLSTLRRYVLALGADLEISAVTTGGLRHLLFVDRGSSTGGNRPHPAGRS